MKERGVDPLIDDRSLDNLTLNEGLTDEMWELVRLSADSLAANAASIAEYLDIRPTDRAITSLPLHYCSGLSVVNSNLARGAGLVLTGRSVIEPEFWELVRRHGVTSLHGVPHTFGLLDGIGFETAAAMTMRGLTSARIVGRGRISPHGSARARRPAAPPAPN